MDDSQILQQLRHGNKEAFKHLFDKYFNALLVMALQYCKEPSDAHDIVQDVFIAFWENRQYSKMLNDGALRPYLFRSVKNKCLDRLTAEKRKRSKLDAYAYLQDEVAEEGISAEENSIQGVNLISKLNVLPPQTYKVVEMVYLRDMKHKEVAAEMALSPNTVRNQLVRAMKILRKNLAISKIGVVEKCKSSSLGYDRS